MAGLGLSNALDRYQQGVAWRQQQEEIGRRKQMQAALDEANRAATGVIDEEKAQWAMSGAPGQWKPSEATMFRAAEKRGMALAQAGLWDQFVENEARVAPMRLKARATAVQNFDATGDADGFMRSIYPTLFDGRRIVGSEKVEGAEAVQGLKAIPNKIRFKLDDGTTQDFTDEDVRRIYGQTKASLVDPMDAAKREAQLNFERVKAEIEAAKQIKVDDNRAGNTRTTEGLKHNYSILQEGVKQEGRMGLARFNNDQAMQRTDKTVAGGLAQANVRASATRYAADKRAEGDKAKSEKTAKDERVKDFKSIHSEVTRVMGMPQQGLMGGNKVSDDHTAAVARATQMLMEKNPTMDMGQAMTIAVNEWKKRGGKRVVPFTQQMGEAPADE